MARKAVTRFQKRFQSGLMFPKVGLTMVLGVTVGRPKLIRIDPNFHRDPVRGFIPRVRRLRSLELLLTLVSYLAWFQKNVWP